MLALWLHGLAHCLDASIQYGHQSESWLFQFPPNSLLMGLGKPQRTARVLVSCLMKLCLLALAWPSPSWPPQSSGEWTGGTKIHSPALSISAFQINGMNLLGKDLYVWTTLSLFMLISHSNEKLKKVHLIQNRFLFPKPGMKPTNQEKQVLTEVLSKSLRKKTWSGTISMEGTAFHICHKISLF